MRLLVVAREDRVDRLGIGVEILLQPVHVEPGAREQLGDARLGDARIDRNHRLMRGFELVLVLRRQRHPRRDLGDRPEDRPVLQHQTNLAVVLHHLAELRRELAAIRAIVVEPLDDRDVTLGIADHRNLRIAQHLLLGQDLVVLGARAARRQQRDAGTDQAERTAAAGAGVDQGRVGQLVHGWLSQGLLALLRSGQIDVTQQHIDRHDDNHSRKHDIQRATPFRQVPGATGAQQAARDAAGDE